MAENVHIPLHVVNQFQTKSDVFFTQNYQKWPKNLKIHWNVLEKIVWTDHHTEYEEYQKL